MRKGELLELHNKLWWVAQEMDNIADAISSAPDLAERNLRRRSEELLVLIKPLEKS